MLNDNVVMTQTVLHLQHSYFGMVFVYFHFSFWHTQTQTFRHFAAHARSLWFFYDRWIYEACKMYVSSTPHFIGICMAQCTVFRKISSISLPVINERHQKRKTLIIIFILHEKSFSLQHSTVVANVWKRINSVSLHKILQNHEYTNTNANT